ncbi:MAG: hypothetical protein JXR83_17330 [Deltaproteobacteria bacterium]|nr:hypothetical protein [Deltaproteobacteria bacterium]
MSRPTSNRARSRLAIVGVLLLTPACLFGSPTEPAPDDLDGLARWLWVNFLAADAATMADASSKLHVAADFDGISEPRRGLLDDLASDDLAAVEMADRDPRPAQGMYLINLLGCTLPQLEAVLLDPDQAAIQPQIYQVYQRTYLTDVEAFDQRTASVVSWEYYYEAQPMPAARYGAHPRADLRHVGASPGVDLPHGPLLVQRIWLPQPAEYFDTDANVFDLDFQIAVYYEAAPGQVAKFYPFWRHIAFTAIGASTDDNWMIDAVLDGEVEWDRRLVEACAAH